MSPPWSKKRAVGKTQEEGEERNVAETKYKGEHFVRKEKKNHFSQA